MIGHLAATRFLAEEEHQLLHLEHYEEEPQESARSIRDSDTDEQGVVRRGNRIGPDGTSELEE